MPNELDAGARRRRELLQQPATERTATILASPSPRRLVRALSAQELFLTLKEAGIDTARPLLAHASRHQLDFLVDLQAWPGGAFDPAALASWVETLDTAGEETLARWITESDEATVVLGLSKLIHVYKADPAVDEDTLPAGRQLASLDGIYYLEPAEACTEGAFLALWRGLQRVRVIDARTYETLLEQVIWAIPAEQEEAAYQARGSRLAERGFPSLEEALEVWTGGSPELVSLRRRIPEQVGSRTPDHLAPGEWSGGRASPALPLQVGTEAFQRVALALGELGQDERDRCLHDLVRLGNRFAVARLGSLAELETHREGLRQALSHLQLGLEVLAGPGAPVERLAELCERLPVFELAGAGTASVNLRAERGRSLSRGWLSRLPRARERLDEAHRSALDAMIGPRPAYGLSDPPRPFRRVEELDEIDQILDVLEALGEILEQRFGLSPAGDPPELRQPLAAHPDPAHIPWHAVLLTAMARAATGHCARPAPLPPAELPSALAGLRQLFEDPAELERVASELGLGSTLAWLMGVHDEQLAPLEATDAIDPRFVPALLVRPSV